MNQSGETLHHLIAGNQSSQEVQNQTLQILNNSINWRDLLSTQLFQVKVSQNIYSFHHLVLKVEIENINVM